MMSCGTGPASAITAEPATSTVPHARSSSATVESPRTHPEALALPGVGTYMAAAVLSMAYDAPHAVVDGNVARVLARLGAVRGDLRAPRTWKRLSADAQALLTPESAGDWNEAMMELGETISHAAYTGLRSMSCSAILQRAQARTAK